MIFFLTFPPPPTSTLFPYTTLFRSLHEGRSSTGWQGPAPARTGRAGSHCAARSEEHTSELQSHVNIVCRLLLEKENKQTSHALLRQHYRAHHARSAVNVLRDVAREH